MLAVLAACGSDPSPTPTSAPATPTATRSAASTPGATTAAPTSTPGKAQWEVDWENLIAAAKQEGELVIALGTGVENWAPIHRYFQDKFGIRIVASGGNSTEVASRVIAEQAANRFEVDVLHPGPTASNQRLIPNNGHAPLEELFMLPEVLDKSLWYNDDYHWVDPEKKYVFSYSATAGIQTLGFTWNSNSISQAEIDQIDSVWDFLDPKFKSKIIAQPATQGSATTPYFLSWVHPQIGPTWIERFVAEMDVQWATDVRLIEDSVARGVRPITLFTGGTDFPSMIAQGLPIKQLAEDVRSNNRPWAEAPVLGNNTGSTVMSIARNPKHPNATKLWINWFLSKEGQTVWHTLFPPPSFPAPTMRDDVTDWGRTDPPVRREPGKTDYFAPEYVPEILAQRTEALARAVELYRAATGQQ
jgi:ABC-type Fe3+ transport system substrate-binding protein